MAIYTNRVYDPTATTFVRWDTALPDTSGASYPGPDAFGNTSDFTVERVRDSGGVTDHGALLGLSDDDHSIYVLLAGRAGGQSIIGGTAAGNNLSLESTSNGTKGNINIVAGSNLVLNSNNITGVGALTAVGDITLSGGDFIASAGKVSVTDSTGPLGSFVNTGADSIVLLHLETTGSNAGECDIKVGGRDPNSNIDGEPGSLYVRNDATPANSTLYVKTSASGVLTGWVNLNQGGGTPAGSTNQIQYNDAGAFGASANLTFTGGSALNVTGTIGATQSVGVVSTAAALGLSIATASGEAQPVAFFDSTQSGASNGGQARLYLGNRDPNTLPVAGAVPGSVFIRTAPAPGTNSGMYQLTNSVTNTWTQFSTAVGNTLQQSYDILGLVDIEVQQTVSNPLRIRAADNTTDILLQIERNNLTTPLFISPAQTVLKAPDQLGDSTAAGTYLFLKSGNGSTQTGAANGTHGGTVLLGGGTGGSTSNGAGGSGGALAMLGGTGGTASAGNATGAGGQIALITGVAGAATSTNVASTSGVFAVNTNTGVDHGGTGAGGASGSASITTGGGGDGGTTGAGGQSGDCMLTTGTGGAGAGTGAGGASGEIILTTGTGGAGGATGNGGAGGDVLVNPGTGGAAIATSTTAGRGGDVVITTGDGGAGTNNATAGRAGNLDLLLGVGGDANGGATGAGGVGGALTVTAGAGGARLSSATAGNPGTGGGLTLTAGVGGNSQVAAVLPATGGAIAITAGVGGTRTGGASGNGGAGGAFALSGGAGGSAVTSGDGGAGGLLSLNAGAGGAGAGGGSAGTPGNINIGTTVANAVVIGKSTTDVSVTRVKQLGYRPFEAETSAAGAVTFNMNDAHHHALDMTENVTSITITDPADVGTFYIKFIQDATARTLTGWPAKVRWSGGSAPTMPSNVDDVLFCVLHFDGTDYFATSSSHP